MVHDELGGDRRAVGREHEEALGRADFHADAAIDAGEGIISPESFLRVRGNALRRALGRAHAAEDAGFHVVDETAPVVGEGSRFTIGYFPRRGALEEVAEYGVDHEH